MDMSIHQYITDIDNPSMFFGMLRINFLHIHDPQIFLHAAVLINVPPLVFHLSTPGGLRPQRCRAKNKNAVQGKAYTAQEATFLCNTDAMTKTAKPALYKKGRHVV